MRARPLSRARALSAGMASRQIRNIARTFTPLTRSQVSSVISSTKARPLTPALLNRMSMALNRETAAATIFRGASSPVMSQAKAATALLPAWACSIADSGRSTARTCAPSSANSFAEAAPMPDAAPVTIAILPASLPMISSFISCPPPSHGSAFWPLRGQNRPVGPKGRRGKAAVEALAHFRSAIFKTGGVAFPLPTLPRTTGEEKDWQALRHRQHDLARCLARQQGIHGIGALLQRETHGDVRLQLPLVVPLQQLVEVLARLGRFTTAPGAVKHAAHVAALQERQIGRQRGDAARGESHDQQAAVPRDAPHRLVEGVAPHGIVDDVRAVAAGELLHLVAHLLFGVVHEHGGAVLAADVHLLVGTDGCDHFQAHQRAELDRRQPDAARGAGHQQGFTGLVAAALLQG